MEDMVIVFDIESGIYTGPYKVKTETDLFNTLLPYTETGDRTEYVITDRKITVPRYVSVGYMDYKTFRRGCYEDPETAFTTPINSETFNLDEMGRDRFLSWFVSLLSTLQERNILLLAHNANYDLNGIHYAFKTETGNLLIDAVKAFLNSADKPEYIAFPESIHDDKTFQIKAYKHTMKMVDTLNLVKCGLAKMGDRASSMYGKDYHKGDEYNYDYEVKTAEDIPPTEDELRYTDRDLQLCLFAGMMAIYPFKEQLKGTGIKYDVNNFPFSATQRDTAVNDGLTMIRKLGPATQTAYRKRWQKYKDCWKDYCRNFGNPKTVDDYKLFQESAGGGVITCGEAYVNKIVKNVGSMDYTSSYPSTASDFLFPVMDNKNVWYGNISPDWFNNYVTVLRGIADEMRTGEMIINAPTIQDRYKGFLSHGFVAEVIFSDIRYHNFGRDNNGVRYWLPTLSYKRNETNIDESRTMRGKVIDEKVYRVTVNHFSLLNILCMYDIKCITLVKGFSFPMRKIPPVIYDRMESGIQNKNHAKDVKKRFEKGLLTPEQLAEETGLTYLKTASDLIDEVKHYYAQSKVPLNAMYGANYRKLLRDKREILDDGEYSLVDGEYDPESNLSYPCGVFIACYGQFKIIHAMLWAIKRKLPIIYVHTDSLKIQGLTAELVDEYNTLLQYKDGKSFVKYGGIGKMDFEGVHDECVCMGNMRIVFRNDEPDKDGNHFEITMSGLNEKKAFPKYKTACMSMKDFVLTFLEDGQRYSTEDETQSGKTRTDYLYAGKHIPGIGYTMQSIVDAEFILNNPESDRQRTIIKTYERKIGPYLTAGEAIKEGVYYGPKDRKTGK